jgi:hypothetical protein
LKATPINVIVEAADPHRKVAMAKLFSAEGRICRAGEAFQHAGKTMETLGLVGFRDWVL